MGSLLPQLQALATATAGWQTMAASLEYVSFFPFLTPLIM
jgi:hypothetical protein